jgi:hypothetical protein
MTELLFTTEQAAEFGQVTVHAIRHWHKTGALPAATTQTIDGKRRVLFSRGAVAALVTGTCELCGDKYHRQRSTSRYCSTTCRQRAHRIRHCNA